MKIFELESTIDRITHTIKTLNNQADAFAATSVTAVIEGRNAEELVNESLALREQIDLQEKALRVAKRQLEIAIEQDLDRQKHATRDHLCVLTDLLIKEGKKFENTTRRLTRPYHKMLELERKIRETAPAAKDFPDGFFGGGGVGVSTYNFAINVFAKNLPIEKMMMNGWPPPREQERLGSAEGAFHSLVHQAEIWRNPPEPECDEPIEWQEVTPDEVEA